MENMKQFINIARASGDTGISLRFCAKYSANPPGKVGDYGQGGGRRTLTPAEREMDKSIKLEMESRAHLKEALERQKQIEQGTAPLSRAP